jgi:hypothetical protein
MATTHIFIVDVITFKCHLEYLFAGTCAKDLEVLRQTFYTLRKWIVLVLWDG